MRVSLSLSMSGCLRGPWWLSCLQSWSQFPSVHSCVQFLSAAESSPGLPGAAWQLLAGGHRPSTQLQDSQYWFCIFCFTSLIISSILSVISKTSICKSLSLFLLFPSSGGRVGVNRESLSLSLLTPCSKWWHLLSVEMLLLPVVWSFPFKCR